MMSHKQLVPAIRRGGTALCQREPKLESVNKEIKGGKRREVIKNKIGLRPALKIAIRTGLETEFLLSWLQNKLG